MHPPTQGTILAIDDEPSVLKIVKAILADSGYSVLTAHGGSAAIPILETITPILIFLDYMMPEMDGPKCMKHFREHGLLRETPVILLTADGHTDEKAQSMGVQDYLKKPFNIDDLLDMVEKWQTPAMPSRCTTNS